MAKITVREKRYLHEIDIERQSLRLDPERRLWNALFALVNMDKGWMIWVEENIPAGCDVRVAMRAVEMRARMLVMRGYGYLGESVIDRIVNGNRPFGDDGTLLAE